MQAVFLFSFSILISHIQLPNRIMRLLHWRRTPPWLWRERPPQTSASICWLLPHCMNNSQIVVHASRKENGKAYCGKIAETYPVLYPTVYFREKPNRCNSSLHIQYLPPFDLRHKFHNLSIWCKAPTASWGFCIHQRSNQNQLDVTNFGKWFSSWKGTNISLYLLFTSLVKVSAYLAYYALCSWRWLLCTTGLVL